MSPPIHFDFIIVAYAVFCLWGGVFSFVAVIQPFLEFLNSAYVSKFPKSGFLALISMTTGSAAFVSDFFLCHTYEESQTD